MGPRALLPLTDLAVPAGEARKAGAGEGGVSRDAVVDAAASVHARPQVLTHGGCGKTGKPWSLSVSLLISLSLLLVSNVFFSNLFLSLKMFGPLTSSIFMHLYFGSNEVHLCT